VGLTATSPRRGDAPANKATHAEPSKAVDRDRPAREGQMSSYPLLNVFLTMMWLFRTDRAAATDSQASEISRLADLRDRSVITDAEFQQGKTKVLS
jgi:hypothetical protein